MAGIKKCINTQRMELGKALPLEMPLSLNIYITNFCNFKCNYCYHTLEKDKFTQQYGDRMNMSLESFKKTIDGIEGFPSKLKTILISGHGEPLLNPEIAAMVEYASSKNVAERIEIITNASVLTHELSDKLIAGGLTALRVSIQGVSKQKYKDISNVDIDFDVFVEQLEYFYKQSRGYDCTVYCKTVDAALDKGEEQEFFDIFSDCCDFINIENVVVFEESIEYKGIKNIGINKNKNGMDVKAVRVCPIPFYTMDVFTDGKIMNCHVMAQSLRGDIDSTTVYKVWNSMQTKQFWKDLLNCTNGDGCANCHFKVGLMKNGDNIDNFAQEIKDRLEKMV